MEKDDEPSTSAAPQKVEVTVAQPLGWVVSALAFAAFLMGWGLISGIVGAALDDEANEPHRDIPMQPEDDEMESAGLDVMKERGAVLRVPRGTATKVTCGGTAAHLSWVCKSRTPASVVYRGGSDVGLDGGTGSVWCTTSTNEDCIDDVITGDTAHVYLYTEVDAGVTMGCSCAYQ
jgi:hypothetical protein